jgi:RNA polymerase sigma-70 factor (ECF subfamily)
VAPHADDITELWQAMRKRLLAFVANRVDRPEDAEDIVQEVFVKIGKGVGGLRDGDRVEAWIYQVTRNAIADHYRAVAREERAGRRLVSDRSSAVSGAGDESVSLAGCLSPMLAQLPPHYREAIILVEYDGLTQTAAAHRIGISVSGMKSRVQRARAQLHELLLACCDVQLDRRNAVRHAERRGPCGCAPSSGAPRTPGSATHLSDNKSSIIGAMKLSAQHADSMCD